MSKKFNFIINFLIIILIIALVAVMMDYYANARFVPTFSNDSGEINVSNVATGDNQNGNSTTDKIIEINKSGDIEIKNDSSSGDLIENSNIELPSGELSGDINVEHISGDKKNEAPEIKLEEYIESPVIMSSENEISSKEKGEILTELDKTLMELLEVVDRVQPVDETRLITDDSEVQ